MAATKERENTLQGCSDQMFYRMKSSCDCCKSWPVRHMSKPGLNSSTGNFWILYYSCIPCWELHENDRRKLLLLCSHVLLCNRCYRVTPELMQRCVMAPLHLSLLPLLHPSTQHLRTPRRRSHGAAKARKTNLPYDGEGALSVCTRVA